MEYLDQNMNYECHKNTTPLNKIWLVSFTIEHVYVGSFALLISFAMKHVYVGKSIARGVNASLSKVKFLGPNCRLHVHFEANNSPEAGSYLHIQTVHQYILISTN